MESHTSPLQERPRRKEDLRQRRSKRLLSQALMDLMEERAFREISVVDICQRAMVHRTTFYAHFKDKSDLLRYMIRELRRSFGNASGPAEGTGLREHLMAEFHRSLTFLREHCRPCLTSLNDTDSPEGRVLERLLAEDLFRRFRDGSSPFFEPEEAETAAWFYAGGLLAVVRLWLESKNPVREEELVERVRRLLPPERGEAT